MIVVESSEKNQEETFAQYAYRRYLGTSVVASTTIKSFFDEDGAIWKPGSRVFLSEPLIDVNQELIISTVTFTLSESTGIQTDLDLKYVQSYSTAPVSSREARRATGAFGQLAGAFR